MEPGLLGELTPLIIISPLGVEDPSLVPASKSEILQLSAPGDPNTSLHGHCTHERTYTHFK